MHIHSSHQTSPGNSHMHGMCRGEVTVFYHHRNNREQPHARNVSRRSHGLLPPPQQQGTATCTECVEAKSRSFTTTATTGNSHMHGMCRGEGHGFLPPPQQQGTATCTECVEAKSRSFTTTATTGNSHMHGMCRGEVTVFYHHRNNREQPHAQKCRGEALVY